MTVSTVVYLLFTFLWLFFFQSDVLAVQQHALSGGQTHYNRLVGAVLITFMLWLLQLGTRALIARTAYCPPRTLHVLTFLPSLLTLSVICNLPPVVPRTSHFVLLFVWLCVAVVVFVFSLFFSLLSSYTSQNVLRMLWVNLLALAVMMVGVVTVSNTNAVYHYQARVETSLLRHDVDRALSTGSRSLETSPGLTMLRAYALSLRGELGDHLFEYPVSGTGADLLPLGDSRFLLYPADSLYRHLGAIPRPGMDSPAYLAAIQRSGQATTAVRDYVLCGLLIDRQLDAFASAIPRYYDVSDSASLPRHYREALTLYTHLRTHPTLVYHHPVTEEDYADLQELEAQYPDSRERHIRVKEKYLGSYWYYYEYMK